MSDSPRTRKALEQAGFAVEADASEFLGLTEEERQLVALRLAVSRAVRQRREAHNLTQAELARRIGSSQSRVAKIEAAASDVTLDLSFKAMFVAGGKLTDLTDVKIGEGFAKKSSGRKRSTSRH